MPEAPLITPELVNVPNKSTPPAIVPMLLTTALSTCPAITPELAEMTQTVHSHLVEGLRPDNPLAQAPFLAAPFSLSTPGGLAALDAEVTRQAAMVAYIDDFRLIMLIALATLPVLLLLREGRRRALTATADD